MKPLDDPAGETTSTGAGRVRGPAARSPVRRAARPGGPGTVTSAQVPGGETSAPSSRERAVARKPDPATRTADGDQSAVPGRGRAPAGSAPEGTSALSAGQRAIAAKMTEAKLEEHVRELCKGLGILRIHVYNSRGTTPGVPDDILIGPYGVLWRELKTMRGKVTPAQQAMGEALLAAGQDWAVWRPDCLLGGAIAAELTVLAGLKAGAA
jgi:hypothetical protein